MSNSVDAHNSVDKCDPMQIDTINILDKVEEVVKAPDTVKPTQIPRPYQDSIFKKALKENIIAFLETGTGKTLIACLLAKHYASPLDNINASVYEQLAGQRRAGLINQSNLLDSLPKLNKKVVFLVPKTPLVKQQAAQLINNAELVVKEYQGNIDHFQTKDIEDAALWHREWSQAQALVMTPQILLNILKVGFMKMSNISLLIFDEAHHCSGDHTYVHIMRDYYKQSPMEDRPRIFGMTASPLSGKSNSELKVNQDIQELQDTMMSKIVTVDPELIDFYAPRASTIFLFYSAQHFIYNLSQIHQFMVNPSSISSISDPVYKFMIYHRHLLYQLKSPKSDKFIRDGDFIKEELGVWLSGKFFHACVLNAWQSSNNSLFPLNLRPLPNTVPVPLNAINGTIHMSSKLNELVVNLNKLYSNATVQSLIFIDRKCVVQILSSFLSLLANMDVIPLNCIPFFLEADMSFIHKSTCISNFNLGIYTCLITTSVAEEGLDISACSVVHMFDIPKSSKSMIQTRGRARQLKSEYIVFVEQGDDKKLKELANRTAEEYYQSGMIRSNQLQSIKVDDTYADYYANSLELEDIESDLPFRVGHAQCNKYDAASKLESYCKRNAMTISPCLIMQPGRVSTRKMQKYLFIRKLQATRIREKAPSGYTSSNIPNPTLWSNDLKNGISDQFLDDFYDEIQLDNDLYGPFEPHKQPTCSNTLVSYMYAYQITFNAIGHLGAEFVIGPPRHKLKDALQSCYLMAIKRLYTVGGFDQLLLPLGDVGKGDSKLHKLLNSDKFNKQVVKKKIKISVGEDYGKNKDDLVMNHDTLCEYTRMTSSWFKVDTTIVNNIDTEDTVLIYPIAIEFGPEIGPYLEFNSTSIFHSFCFILVKPLTSPLPSTVIWINQMTPCRISYKSLPMRTISKIEYNQYLSFQSILFDITIRKQHHMDVNKRLELIKIEYLLVNDNLSDFSHWLKTLKNANFMNDVNVLILPLISTIPHHITPVKPLFNSIDFTRMQNYNYNLITHPTMEMSFTIDSEMISCLLDIEASSIPCSILYTLDNHEITQLLKMQSFEDIYLSLKVRMATDANPNIDISLLNALMSKLAISSLNRSYFVVGVTNQIRISDKMTNSKYTYEEYYMQRHGIQLEQDQMMFLAKNSYTLNSHQLPDKGKQQNKQINLPLVIPLQCCSILPIPVTWLKLSNLIPTVFYKLEHMTNILDIMGELEINASDDISRLVQAMTHPESLDIYNYERLEFLGDAFLKYAVGLDLFNKYPTWNEGQLSMGRDALVRNSYLAKISKKYHLPNRVYMKHFNPQLFCTRDMDCTLMTNVHKKMIIGDNYEQWDGVRRISNKNVADLVESLIGGVYCTHGEVATFKLLVVMGICSPEVLIKQINKIETCLLSKQEQLTITACQHALHYQFNHKQLFVECSRLNTLQFDRLEYLGDAVLDFMCALYSFINYPMDLPGKLTQFKQGLVQNIAFSQTTFKLRLFTFVSSLPHTDFFNSLKMVNQWDLEGYKQVTEQYNGHKVMGDIFEAFSGGIFMDLKFDLNGLWGIMGHHITEILIEETRTNQSQDMVLNSYLKQLGKGVCKIYPELVNGVYECTVYVDNEKMGIGKDEELNKATVKATEDVMEKLANGEILYKFKMESSRESVNKTIFDDKTIEYLIRTA